MGLARHCCVEVNQQGIFNIFLSSFVIFLMLLIFSRYDMLVYLGGLILY